MAGLHVAMVAVVGACGVMTGFKIWQLSRDPGNRPLRHLVLALVALSIALTLQPFAPLIDIWLNTLDVTRVAANCLTVVAVASGRGFLAAATASNPGPRRARHQWLIASATIVLILVLYASTPARYAVDDPYVREGDYRIAALSPAEGPYLVPFLIYLGWSLGRSVADLRRYVQITATRPLVVVGLRLVTAGCATGLGYVAFKGTATLLATVDRAAASELSALAAPCFLAAALTVLGGVTLPSWGRRIGLDRLLARIAARRRCRRLKPLWSLVRDAAPDVVLLPHPTDPTLRQCRMVVEILDGYVQLRPWLPGAPARPQWQLCRHAPASRIRREAGLEAAALTTAARAKASSPVARDNIAQAGQPPPDPSLVEEGSSALLLDWLMHVAASAARDPARSPAGRDVRR